MAFDRVTSPDRSAAVPARPARAPRAGRRRWAPPLSRRARRLDVAKVRLPGEVLVVLDGALRRSTVAAFTAAIGSIGRHAKVVVDLSRLCRIDRAGVEALSAACSARGADICLVGVAENVRRCICRHAAPLQAHLVATG